MTNLTLHRWLLVFGGLLMFVSVWLIHWFAMFEQHELALRAHFCLWASFWWFHRMLKHCERFEFLSGRYSFYNQFGGHFNSQRG